MPPFDEFTSAVRARRPRAAVVLGSGLGAVPHYFAEAASVAFADVPGLAATSVHGHSGAISLGECAGVPLVVLRGRLHYYEGHSWDRVAAPVRLMADWGVQTLILTNAAGGIHDRLNPGDLMVLRGHLWLQTPQAVVGQVSNLSERQDRLETCPTGPYSQRLIELLQAAEPDRELLAGIYAAVTGPCYETPAEIRALKAMGADAVGMSTAFEAETAASLGMEVAAVSCITNKAAGLTCGTLDHKEVLANAGRPAERISTLLETILPLVG
jgi:purine-nucleoside phosphorylase